MPESPPRHELHVQLDADPTSPSRARGLVRDALSEWGIEEVEQVASLLVSELVNNVLIHSAGDCRLDVEFDGSRLKVGVWDVSDARPVRRESSTSSGAGRGLALVEGLSTQWGWDPHAQGGKVVWFELAVAGDGARRPGS